MFSFLSYIRIDTLSYILGVITGLLFAGLLALLRTALPRIKQAAGDRLAAARQELAAGADTHLRNDVLKQAQKNHLAAQMFRLDEIAIKPMLLAPPPLLAPGSNLLDEIEATLQIPYLPDWPELSAVYHGRTISLPEALSKGANLAITGIPGSGKSTALAYLASMVARRADEMGELKDYLPVLIHAADLSFVLYPPSGSSPKPPIETLTEAVARRSSLIITTRLPGMIRNHFHTGQALLMVDGVDELPPEQVDKVVSFLSQLVEEYPKVRLVMTASPTYYDGILTAGILPVALAAWDEKQRTEFLVRWADLWETYIAPGIQVGTATDPLILRGWLGDPDYFATPLELTLKIWAAFSGDSLGPDLPASLDAYLRRMTLQLPRAREALEKLAAELVKNFSSSALAKDAESWLGQLKQLLASEPAAAGIPATGQGEGVPDGWQSGDKQQTAPPPTALPAAETPASQEAVPTVTEEAVAEPVEPTAELAPATNGPVKAASKAPKMSPAQEMLSKLVDAGLLIRRQDRYSFIHPLVQGYLAAAALSKEPGNTCLETQPDWTGKQTTVPFLASAMDLGKLAAPALGDTQDPLFRKLMSVGRWLQLAPAQARWRGSTLRQLVNLLQSETYPVTLRAKAVSALVFSGDPGITTLLKQLFTHRQENVRVLAVFGCGLARDQKSTGDLIQLTGDPSARVRQAAVLALAAIGNRSSLDAIGQILLQASEDMRRCAAEALAYLPEEGHPALKEGSTMEDLLVRRAVVYGLARVGEPWAIDILKQMQVEDEQWAVRSAATQALEELQHRDAYLPQRLPPPQESPWLLAYAAKQGLGVLPGRPALNLMNQALKSDDIYEIFASLAYLERIPDSASIPNLYQVMFGSGGELREAGFFSLWQLAGSGMELPAPAQFGLG
jgi:hypothetical protein